MGKKLEKVLFGVLLASMFLSVCLAAYQEFIVGWMPPTVFSKDAYSIERKRAEAIHRNLARARSFPVSDIRIVGRLNPPAWSVRHHGISYIMLRSDLLKNLSDGAVAFWIGHEMAHGILGVSDDPQGQLQCDRFALEVMTRAGYERKAALEAMQYLYPLIREEDGADDLLEEKQKTPQRIVELKKHI